MGIRPDRQADPMLVAVPMAIRGHRLRQILHVLPVDVMEAQMLAREFFSRCDLQDTYMSLEKCSETFGISTRIAQGIYAYIRMNKALDDVPFNYARKLELLYTAASGRSSVIDDLQQWQHKQHKQQPGPGQASMSMGMGSTGSGLHSNQGPSQPILRLPKIYLTFENFVEAAVYLSPRASLQQRVDVAFSILDADGNGLVDAQEIKNVMLDSIEHIDSGSARAKIVEDKKCPDSGSMQKMFRQEIDELVADLTAQYRTDEFSKAEFVEFAKSVEFLNCFTVNKHWLRDILGDGQSTSKRYARPQDAEMKQFLDAIADDENIDREVMTETQEKLRDHLVDTVDDLKTVSRAEFAKMNIDRRVSRFVLSNLKALQSDGFDDGAMVFSPLKEMSAAPSSSKSALPPIPNNRAVVDVDMLKGLHDDFGETFVERAWDALSSCYRSRIVKLFPSTHRTLQCALFSLYVLQMLVAWLVSARTSDLGALAALGLYLCVFMAPLSLFYPFVTKWLWFAQNSFGANAVLYATSRECQRVNAAFAICYTLTHIIWRFVGGLGDGVECALDSIWNVSGWALLLAALVCFARWWLQCTSYTVSLNPFASRTSLGAFLSKTLAIACFVWHCDLNALLCASLLPTLIIIAVYVVEFSCKVRTMEVELAKNERPNFVILYLRNGENSKKELKYRSGQYVMLSCPSLSGLEFHPFYITSSPHSAYVRVSLLSCGAWTQKMWSVYVSQNIELYDLRVAGPFGLGFSEDVMHYRRYNYLLVIAAGKGSVEVVASLLDFMCSNLLAHKSNPITAIYVYWMVSADDGCYWFYKLLRDLRNSYKGAFFPVIFVTSNASNPNHIAADDVNSFGLNFFLALRRDSVQAIDEQTQLNQQHLVTQSNIQRLSAGRLSDFRHRKVSIFRPNRRPSRFHGLRGMNGIHGLRGMNGDLNEDSERLSLNEKLVNEKLVGMHGISLSHANDPNAEDISMQSPDFRHAFSKIREQLINANTHYSTVGAKAQKGISRDNTMLGIVPSLIPNAAANRRFEVGTFFVGPEILEKRLAHYCQRFTDDQVLFHFNPMIIGANYANKYST